MIDRLMLGRLRVMTNFNAGYVDVDVGLSFFFVECNRFAGTIAADAVGCTKRQLDGRVATQLEGKSVADRSKHHCTDKSQSSSTLQSLSICRPQAAVGGKKKDKSRSDSPQGLEMKAVWEGKKKRKAPVNSNLVIDRLAMMEKGPETSQ